VLAEIKNRGVRVCMLVCGGFKGLPDAVSAVCEKTIVQTCIVHLLRNSFKYASKRDWAQRLDGVLTPPLAAIRLRLAPPSIGVHRLVAQRTELGDQARFPCARHPGDQHPPHGPSLCSRDPEHPAWILIGGSTHSTADPDDPRVKTAATQTPRPAPDPIRNREAPRCRRA
jgi:hypothetical protein